MARTALTRQQIVPAGLAPSYAAANADGHSFEGDGKSYLHVKNTDASPITVTVKTPAQVGGLDVAEQAVTVPATTGDKIIGPFSKAIYNQSDGDVHVDFSAVANVTCALIGP